MPRKKIWCAFCGKRRRAHGRACYKCHNDRNRKATLPEPLASAVKQFLYVNRATNLTVLLNQTDRKEK